MMAVCEGRIICGYPGYSREGIESIAYDRSIIGICEQKGRLAWNANSGGAAINLAYHMGATKIILLGYDMQWTGGKSHHHGDHPEHLQHRMPGFHRWLRYFDAIQKDLVRLGVTVYNCTPGSALTSFRMADLEDML
jgi:hypothetical protein